MYGLDPKGTVTFNGVKVPVILCHKDSSNLGLGSNHADVLHWFPKFGKSMDSVRNDVAALMNGSSGSIAPPSSDTTFVNIKFGDEGSRVQELQQKLISLGYSCGSWGADGDFGSATQGAVQKFQSDHNLTPDGIVGQATWNAILKAIEDKNKPTPAPQPTANEIYRVRLSWDNPSSQIGAFKVFENAKVACDKLGGNYKVFNSAGQEVYPKKDTTPVTPAPSQPDTPATPATKYTGVVLGSASHDERGQYRGGQAGDQTKTEVATQNWYKGKWDTVLRPKTNLLAEKIAAADE